MSIEQKYKKLDEISHILARSGMYIGSIKPHTATKWILDGDKFTQKELTYNPAFLKIFDEILINSVDESKRSGTRLKTIKVSINNNRISIWDDGGIDVVKHKEYDQWVPEMIFSSLRAGSNFSDDEQRTTAGLNGVGSVLTNVFSREFKVSTCDGKNLFVQVFSDNMRDKTEPIIKRNKLNHTEINYLPDYEKFGLSELDETHYLLLQKRVYDVAGCNPHIKVYFNGEEIKIRSFEDYIKFYKSEFFFEINQDKSWAVGIAHSDDGFQQISFINSTDTYDGGTHIDYILSQILSQLREFFQKKHKVDIKPSELKNHICLFVNATVVNPSFSSQTKEKLITETKDFGFTHQVSEKMIKSILKSDIVQSVLDWIQQKKSADENKLARELNKNLAKIKVDKLIDAKGKDRWKCSLSLFEGDSASSAFRKYRDPQTQGAFSLRGKFINAAEISTQKLIQNNEVVNLMGALGLKLGQKFVPGTLRYGRILFFCDADYDGSSIVALLINFLYKYWPDLFDHPIVFKAETPIVVCKNFKSKKKLSFYTQSEYEAWLNNSNPKDWEIEYKKGLAALLDDEYAEIINNPRLTQITVDDLSKESLSTWFGRESEPRKVEMLK